MMNKRLPILSAEELEEFISISNWQIDDGKLFSTFSFSSYSVAANFVQYLASLAEEQNHHPEILLTWKKVSVWLYTHDVSGITKLDTQFATLTNKHFSSTQ